MSDIKDCTSVKDLWIEQNLRNFERGQTLAPIGRRVVMVQNLDGTQEIDLDWLAEQYEREDYWQTVHDASIYGQGA